MLLKNAIWGKKWLWKIFSPTWRRNYFTLVITSSCREQKSMDKRGQTLFLRSLLLAYWKALTELFCSSPTVFWSHFLLAYWKPLTELFCSSLIFFEYWKLTEKKILKFNTVPMVEFQDAPWLLKKGRLTKEGLFYSISFEVISMQQPNT